MEITTYLNVDELLSASRVLAASYPELCKYEDAPLTSIEGRPVPLLHLSTGNSANRRAVLITSGVHAREWVPPDATIYWIADLLEAYTNQTGLRFGNAYYPADQIASILNEQDYIVMPCVNPDGRKYSQDVWSNWRGNRNVVEIDGQESFGVDLNRNYDFIWDFEKIFHAGTEPASNDPFNYRQIYHGVAPASEPEVRNVVSALDRFPVHMMVDVHSYWPCVLRSWGHEQSQNLESTMNFQNPDHHGNVGRIDDNLYREFHPETDATLAKTVSQNISTAISKVQGSSYPSMSAHELGATSGAGDDYAYSRQFLSEENDRVIAFTIECGTEFQPDFPKAAGVMKEVSVALLEMGLRSARANLVA